MLERLRRRNRSQIVMPTTPAAAIGDRKQDIPRKGQREIVVVRSKELMLMDKATKDSGYSTTLHG